MRLRCRKWIAISGTFIVALVVALFGGLNPLQPFGNSAAAQQAFGANDMQQMVNSYCLACHSDALATSGLSLQQIDFANPGANAETLEAVVKKLRAHMMPPSGMPRPTFETYGIMTGWLESELDQAWATDPDPSRVTPLHAAVQRGNLNAVNVLLSHGANVEGILEKPTPVRRQATDYNFHDALLGSTPLWLGARFSEPLIMEALLEAGADPLTVNNMSYPAQRLGEFYIADEGAINLVMAAMGMGHARLRVSWGTPERRAGQLQDRQSLVLDSVMLAVQAGADINATNAEGQTALAFARQRGYASVVSFLEVAGATE